MASSGKRGAFLREATGLVREISPLRAMWFNFCAFTGGIVALNYNYSAFYPAAPTFGLSPLDLAQLILAVALVPFGLIFVGLLARMPRTGGDYVFTSRILSPFLGWLETWTLLFANLATIGFELLQIAVVTQAFFVVMAKIYGSSVWAGLSEFYSVPLNQAVVGVVLVALMGLLGFTRARTFTFIITVFGVLGVSGIIIQFIMYSFVVSGDAFANNFQLFAGVSTQQVVDKAFSVPVSPLVLPPINFAILGTAMYFALFDLLGCQYSVYLAGELKGNYVRNGLVSILGSIWLYTVVTWVLMVPAIFGRFGYTFLHAWAYLAFNYPSDAPLQGINPQSAVLGLIASPGLWPLWLYVTVVADLVMFSLGPTFCFMISRMVLAWSMDRVVPGWFAELDKRTATPVRIYVLTLGGGLVFYLMSFPPINLNLASLSYYPTLLSALNWIVPGFNAVFVAFRQKELFETGPFKRRFAGLPVLGWFGIVWLGFILPFYAAIFIEPLVSGFFRSPTWQYASSTGVNVVALIVLVGSVIYFVSKYYNKRRGIDVSLIFKEIPPE